MNWAWVMLGVAGAVADDGAHGFRAAETTYACAMYRPSVSWSHRFVVRTVPRTLDPGTEQTSCTAPPFATLRTGTPLADGVVRTFTGPSAVFTRPATYAAVVLGWGLVLTFSATGAAPHEGALATVVRYE